MADIVEDIKSRLSIDQVVTGYVQLKKAGVNFKGCCPFHAEKTPSFVVSPEKQLAYCFGCHKGGDMFTFIQEVEGVDFSEAINILADKAGLKREDYFTQKTQVQQSSNNKKGIFEVNEAVCKFYEKNLWAENADSQGALQYFRDRGLTDETIREFRLGFAPNSFDKTYSYLLDKGFSKDLLLDGGLVVSKDTGAGRVYDRFRNRVIFPTFTHDGRVVAFGGRVLSSEDSPKYLNSPDTPVFKKSKVIYGFKAARTAIKENNFVVIVEGYMDVIASHQAGVKNVIASSGTAISATQAKILKSLTNDFRLSFDSDNAGVQAARRTIEMLQPFDVNIKIISVVGGKDPDEIIMKDASLWEKALLEAKMYFDYLIDKATLDKEHNTLENRKAVLADLLPLLKNVVSSLERDEYVRKLASKLGTSPEIIYADLKQTKSSSFEPKKPVDSPPLENIKNSRISLSRYFLSLIVAYPDLLENLDDKERWMQYLEKSEKKVYLTMTSNYNRQANFEEFKMSLGELGDEVLAKLSILALYAEDRNQSLVREAIDKEFEQVCERLVKDYRKNRLRELTAQIKEAREIGDESRIDELLEEKHKVNVS
ncbi:DNA primase [Patescibacteria group bacterium]|nr:DNA primase [Patescibacteria group bacterium]